MHVSNILACFKFIRIVTYSWTYLPSISVVSKKPHSFDGNMEEKMVLESCFSLMISVVLIGADNHS